MKLFACSQHQPLYLAVRIILIIGCLAGCGPASLPETVPATDPAPTRTPQPSTATSPPVAAGWGNRLETSLDGRWQFVRVASLDDPLPKTGWQNTDVPGLLDGYRSERAWFRRSFEVPADWQGRRLILHFGGVKYNSRVLVNGVTVGGCFNGYDAFELDISEAVLFGERNELLVGVHDWTGVFSAPLADFPDVDWDTLRIVPADRILSPVGGLFNLYGIWDSVRLQVSSPVTVDSVFVRPLVMEGRLEVDVTITNTGSDGFSAPLQARVFGWYGSGRDESGQWILQGEPLATFAAQPVSLEVGQSQMVTLSLDAPPLDRWDPYHPNLYILETGFAQQDGDALRVRFGYRQLTIQGGDFYLNGEKIHMLATSWWPTGAGDSRTLVESQLRAIRGMNAVAFRTHTQPWQQIWYELADEVGVMMIPEGAVWNDDASYRVNDPAFWGHYRDHLLAMVAKLRNHPSVVMWSLENEFYGNRVRDGLATEGYLSQVGQAVKQADPTRPITYESDGDPGGVADVIGLHYPNEFPLYRNWPADAYWLDTALYESGGGGMFWSERPFVWDRRKPLYVGEYLWIPAPDPSSQTVFFGDQAYRNYAAYRTLAKAEAWKMQILAYRHYEVSGHSPWTVIEHGPLDETNPLWIVQRDMYRPLAAFLNEYDSRFYSGEMVTRTVELFNDTMRAQAGIRFRWTLMAGETELDSGEESLSMPSGDHQERTLSLRMPIVDKRTDLLLRLTLSVADEEQFRQDYPLFVFPPVGKWTLPRDGLDIYDPSGTLPRAWLDLGANKLDRLEDWNGQAVLVIGPQALQNQDHNARTFLNEKVDAGGRILVLPQEETASAVLPVPVGSLGSSLAFIQVGSHPVMEGFSADDFRWWRGDLQVSTNEVARTGIGGAIPLLVSGSMQGIANSPLLEVRQGKGTWLLCQLQVIEKLEREPVARPLLEQMLRYLGEYEALGGGVRFVDQSGRLPASTLLHQLDWQSLDGDWASLQYPQVRTLVVHGSLADIADHLDLMRSYLQSGGTILFDQPDPDMFDAIQVNWSLPVETQPYQGVTLKNDGEGMLSDLLALEDLYWLGKPGPQSHIESPLASDMASLIFAPRVDVSQLTMTLAARGADIVWGGADRTENGINFYSNARVEWMVDVPESAGGLALITLLGRGDLAGDEFPKAAIWLDDRTVGIVSVGASSLQKYSLWVQAEAGQHRLAVEFINDYYDPPADRNLFIAAYAITPAYESQDVRLYTTPPSLIEMPIGSGRLLINTIRWDQTRGNGIKAQRFFASLLTGLGVRWKPNAAIINIQAESMTAQAGLPYFTRAADHVAWVTDGYIQGVVSIPEGGDYQIGILGRGTPVMGIYPILQIHLDGVYLGQVEIASDTWTYHTIQANLPSGEHTLRLSFVNDSYSPNTGEDRNVWVDEVQLVLIE